MAASNGHNLRPPGPRYYDLTKLLDFSTFCPSCLVFVVTDPQRRLSLSFPGTCLPGQLLWHPLELDPWTPWRAPILASWSELAAISCVTG